MGSFVIILPTGLVAAFLFLFLSTQTAEWFTWGILAIINVFFLFKSFSAYRCFMKGIDISAGEIVAIASQPFISSVTLIAIIFLLFVDIGKLHLIWFYPTISILFEFTIGKGALKKLEPFRKEPNE